MAIMCVDEFLDNPHCRQNTYGQRRLRYLNLPNVPHMKSLHPYVPGDDPGSWRIMADGSPFIRLLPFIID